MFRGDVQVFSGEGNLVQTISREGDSRVDLGEPRGMCTDGEGRVFVASESTIRVLS